MYRKMKVFIVVFKIVLFCVASCFAACTPNENPPQYEIYVMIDYTDAELFKKYASNSNRILNTIMSKFPLRAGAGGVVHLVPLSDVGSTIERRFVCDQLPEGLNKYNKPASYIRFQAELKESWAEAFGQEVEGTQYSSIYEPLCMAVQELSYSDYNRKVIILLSDMIENSKALNMYRREIESGSGIQKLSDYYGCELSDGLSEIDIRVLSYRTVEKEEDILRSKRFWKEVFENRSKSFYWGSALRF